MVEVVPSGASAVVPGAPQPLVPMSAGGPFVGFKVTRKYTLAVYVTLASTVMVFFPSGSGGHLLNAETWLFGMLGLLGVHGAANILDKQRGGLG